ncbi:MAG: hypothetical protein ACM32E_30200 [Gemmatimonadota bacterium]
MTAGHGDRQTAASAPRPGPGGGPGADLAAVLAEVAPGGARFGHREHIHLAFLAVQRYGPAAAPEVVAGWLREIAARHGAPQKFHATMTRAWAGLVAHHAAACPPGTGFAAFAARNPALLDKRLLSRHYSPGLLASPAARAGWADPDLAAFPWRAGPAHRRGPQV